MSSDLNSGYSDITLDEAIDMIAEQYSLSKERKELSACLLLFSTMNSVNVILNGICFRYSIEALRTIS
ncbi:MAG: hypothetical protein K2H19_03680 [Ruminococcus sp.]|nr:hypothetical protein [Ruminococcus sp.]